MSTHGICSLVQEHGKYVKSHLIPRSLTLISSNGNKRIETSLDPNHRIKRRFDSWYDLELCIRKGEDILSDIDNLGIQILRNHQLIWSGWQGSTINSDDLILANDGIGLRVIKFQKKDANDLQLFFLSLLWRAGATKIPEFDTVKLDQSIIEDLRQRLLNKDCEIFDDYPVMLFPIITKGYEHNRTPITERYTQDGIESLKNRLYVRFYFDGLVAYIFLPQNNLTTDTQNNTQALFVNDSSTLVFCRSFDGSRTLDNLMVHAGIYNT